MPLLGAVLKTAMSVLRLLLDAGADTGAKVNSLQTILHVSATANPISHEIREILESAQYLDIDTDAKDDRERTARECLDEREVGAAVEQDFGRLLESSSHPSKLAPAKYMFNSGDGGPSHDSTTLRENSSDRGN